MKKTRFFIIIFLIFSIISLSSCDLNISFGRVSEECEHILKEEIINPTCNDRGYTIYECEKCEYSYKDNYKDALGHSYDDGVITKAASCKECGILTKKCIRCNDEIEEEIPKCDHTIAFKDNISPSCTSSGLIGGSYCSVCGDVLSKDEILASLSHEIVDTVISPTCTSDGYTLHKCKNCDYEYKDNYIDKLNHNYVDGICTNCEKVENNTYKSTYGYEQLLTEENGANLGKLYLDLEEKCIEINESNEDYTSNKFKINYSNYDISNDDAIYVWKIFKADNPYFYFIDTVVSSTSTDIYLTIASEYLSYSNRLECINLINLKIDEYLNLLSNNYSNYQKALIIHDEIIKSINYAYDESNIPSDEIWAHNIYGVFNNTGAVCEGYAKAFQLLLNAVGINNIFVTGSGGSEDHAWNLVEIEEECWYWFDLTWDDTPSWETGIRYNYFCKNDTDITNKIGYSYISNSEETFLSRHTSDSNSATKLEKLYNLPKRSDNTYNNNDAVGHKFIVDSIEYAIIGANKIAVSKINKTGEIQIPSKVEYNSIEYNVTALGSYNDNVFMIDSILEDGITKIIIPKSIEYIVDNSLDSSTLKEIEVHTDNEKFESEDGILYTKGMYTLIKYPSAKEGLSLDISNDVYHIAYKAFNDLKYLTSINIGDNVNSVGVYNMGYNYFDSDIENKNISLFEAEFASIFAQLKTTRSITISENNKNYIINNSIIYSYDYKIMYFIIKNDDYIILNENVERIVRYSALYCNNLSTIYYLGNNEKFIQIQIEANNDLINSAEIYYYSEEEPLVSGNYFYISNNTIKRW